MKPRLLVPLLLTTLAAGGLALCAPPGQPVYVTGTHEELRRERVLPPTGAVFQAPQALQARPAGVLLVANADAAWQRDRRGVWRRLAEPTRVHVLVSQDQETLAAAADGVWRSSGERWERDAGSPREVMALSADGAELWALARPAQNSRASLWRRREGWSQIAEVPADLGEPLSLLAQEGAVRVGTTRGLFRWTVGSRDWMREGDAATPALFGAVRGLAVLPTHHLVAVSNTGLALGTGAGVWRQVGAAEGLPISDLTCVAVAPNGAVWLGSRHGLIRWHDGAWSYFAGPRWLVDDRVRCLSVGDDGSIYVGTETGINRLSTERLTLDEKAARYQHDLEARDRRYGYVTVIQLRPADDPRPPLQEISDNDGLWTAMYVGSQCFRYAATHSKAARDQAWRSMQAVLRLESITGLPGFPARSISNEKEPGFAERSHGEWHRSTVEPGWWWKGDTSSDEIDGHYFAFMLYYDLAANEAEKARIRETCRRITDHIISHGYYLVDVDGKPTRWGVWAPERLNDDPEWSNEHGLNSLEILSHLKVAAHVTGDPKYQRAYEELIQKHGYALNTLGVKQLPPEGEINHSDDELAYLAYYPLLRLERDPALVQLYRASFRKQWEAVRPEANPLWNFMYGACTGQACDVEAGVQALREIPLDLVRWPVRNSVREDLKYDPEPDRFGKRQLLRPLPWTERPLHKWNGNPYEVDGGDGRNEEDQTMWLLPYWLGRYHRLIR